MENEEKFYVDKMDVTGQISEFINLCEKLGRDWKDELEDILADARKDAGV